MPAIENPFNVASPLGASIGNLMRAFTGGMGTMEERQAKAAQAEFYNANTAKAKAETALKQQEYGAPQIFSQALAGMFGPLPEDPNFVGPVAPGFAAPTISRDAHIAQFLPQVAEAAAQSGNMKDVGSIFRAFITNTPGVGQRTIDLASMGAGGDYAHTQTGFGDNQLRQANEAAARDTTARRGQDRSYDASVYGANSQAETARRGQDLQAKTQETIDNRNVIVVANPDGTFTYKLKREAPGQAAPMPAGAVPARAKPLPTAALKLQQEELDAIGAASGINADLAAVAEQLESGALKLGPINNVANRARNMAGLSNQESQNLASFEATLERLRNESLRLNKGVQTEGDAVRAWNELLANIGDAGVVKQRLAEIRRLNDRAVALRKMAVDQIRANYGHEPLDTSGYQNVPAALGAGASPAAAPMEGRTATGPGGEKIVMRGGQWVPLK